MATQPPSTGANLDCEATLWQAADKLRNTRDAAEYTHGVLGLIFLTYIADAFEERHQQVLAEQDEGAAPEDRDEYLAANVFWGPKEARYPYRLRNAKQLAIGKLVGRDGGA